MEISRSRGGATLQDSVIARLSVAADDVLWDAYRDDQGRWIVTAATNGRTVGNWTYESLGRTVHPLDESARALMGGGPSAVVETDVEPERAPVESTGSDTTSETPASDPVRPRLVSITSDPTAHEDSSAGVDDSTGQTLVTHPDPSAPRRAKRTKGRKGRASVPSWDEILFGASKPED